MSVHGKRITTVRREYCNEERRDAGMLKKLRNLLKDEKGQDMIEYGLLASFISIVAIGVIVLIATPLIALYQSIVDAL